MIAYSTADEIDIDGLSSELLKNKSVYKKVDLADDVDNAIMFRTTFSDAGSSKDVFVFKEGSVIFWNLNQSEVTG